MMFRKDNIIFAVKSNKCAMDYQQILENIYQTILPYAKEGKQADYIPALAKVDPDQFGMCLHTVLGEVYSIEQADTRFSIQSISKVFALAMCLSLKGHELWERVGKEPSGTAFNSLVQLEVEKGLPRNPFINAGAIVLADILLANLEHPEEEFLAFIHALAGDDTIGFNEEVAVSEREKGYLNAAIANLLKYHGRIEGDIEQVLRFYFRRKGRGTLDFRHPKSTLDPDPCSSPQLSWKHLIFLAALGQHLGVWGDFVLSQISHPTCKPCL